MWKERALGLAREQLRTAITRNDSESAETWSYVLRLLEEQKQSEGWASGILDTSTIEGACIVNIAEAANKGTPIATAARKEENNG